MKLGKNTVDGWVSWLNGTMVEFAAYYKGDPTELTSKTTMLTVGMGIFTFDAGYFEETILDEIIETMCIIATKSLQAKLDRGEIDIEDYMRTLQYHWFFGMFDFTTGLYDLKYAYDLEPFYPFSFLDEDEFKTPPKIKDAETLNNFSLALYKFKNGKDFVA